MIFIELLFLSPFLVSVFSKTFDPCKGGGKLKIDALLWAQKRGEFYLFNDEYFWHYNYFSGTLGQMQILKDYWPEVTTPIDSVTDFQNGTVTGVLFFQGYKYWVYTTKTVTDKKQKLVMTGTFASIELKTVDAIQIHNFLQLDKHTTDEQMTDEQMGIICTDGNIYLCTVRITKDMYIDGCTAFPKYKDLLGTEQCNGFAIFENGNAMKFVGSGQKIVVYANETHKYGSKSIKEQIYKCKEAAMSMATTVMIAGCGVIAIGIVLVIVAVLIQKFTSKKEMDEDDSVDEEEPESVAKPAPAKKVAKVAKKAKTSKK